MSYTILFAVLLIFILVKFARTPSQKTTDHNTNTSTQLDDRLEFNSSSTDDECWVDFDQTVKKITVNGQTLSGGMYVGEGLASVDNYGIEPCLIRPSLKVANVGLCTDDNGMSYWPSYSHISPEARTGYLHWLSTGRNNPEANIGYVFLYFYGLERQILHAKCSGDRLYKIKGELKRLLSIYSSNRSFRRYCEGLLGVIAGLSNESPTYVPETNPNVIARGMFPAQLKIHLGQLVSQGNPIPWNSALEWVLRHPDTRLRVPAKRCPQEFSELFKELYKKKFGAGLTVSPNKKKISVDYHPASSSLRSFSHPINLPDPTALSQPLKQLRKIVEEAMAKLDSYSRLKGSSPDTADGLAGFSLLPDELKKNSTNSEFEAIVTHCKRILNSEQYQTINADKLTSHWPIKNKNKITRAEAKQLTSLLGSAGYGVEPDPRYGGKTPSADDLLVLFNLPQGGDKEPTSAFYQASALCHLAGLVAASDGEVTIEERELLNRHLSSLMGLTSSEQVRLNALFEWIISRPASFAGLKAKLDDLTTAQKQGVADFLIGVAGADGIIHPNEIKVLEKAYKALGLNASDVKIHIHRLMASNDEPVVVRTAEDRSQEFVVPNPERTVSENTIKINSNTLEAKRKQTQEVAAILENVFKDEHEDTDPTEVESSVDEILDKPHQQLLAELKEKTEWPVEEFNTVAHNLGLMPSGAFEVLNDAALEHFEDEVLFDGDPIEVNHEVLEEMVA